MNECRAIIISEKHNLLKLISSVHYGYMFFVCLSVCPSVCLSLCVCAFSLSLSLSLSLSISISLSLSVQLCLSLCPALSLFISFSQCLCVCVSLYLSRSLPVYLSCVSRYHVYIYCLHTHTIKNTKQESRQNNIYSMILTSSQNSERP